MSVLIQNGEIITATERYRADIYCADQTITRIGHDLQVPPDTPVLDARGLWVLPGFIDPHVHIHLPLLGTCAKDNYETASRAALLGGTTTVIEMICPNKEQDLLEQFALWQAQAAGHSACDYSFHMGVPRFDAHVPGALQAIIAAGIPSLKVFLAYQGIANLSDAELFAVLGFAREQGALVTAHCENAELIVALQQQCLAAGRTGTAWHYHSRPPLVEASGTAHLLTLARLREAAVYVVHLSCQAALQEVLRARTAGARVWVEAVLPHLVLDRSYAERPDFEGAKYVMSPPLRDAEECEALWNGLRQGFIQTVATDHAPFDFHGQKDRGRADFTRIPNGIPSLEERVKLLYTLGVVTGRIDLHTWVNCASTQPARIFGLYPRKGVIQAGADADLVLFDPMHRSTISAATHAMNVDYSAYEGWPVAGRAATVLVRGQVVVDGGVYQGQPGFGRMLKREPQYF